MKTEQQIRQEILSLENELKKPESDNEDVKARYRGSIIALYWVLGESVPKNSKS